MIVFVKLSPRKYAVLDVGGSYGWRGYQTDEKMDGFRFETADILHQGDYQSCLDVAYEHEKYYKRNLTNEQYTKEETEKNKKS